MASISRRSFIKQSAAGAAALTMSGALKAETDKKFLGPVPLGVSGVHTSRVAMGAGSHGWKRTSEQVKLGMEQFVELARYAYDRGITFFETADIYGSHQFFRETLKYVPRDKVVIETKVWHRPVDWIDYKNINETINRFRKELGTDYLDIVLLHSQVDADWNIKYKREMDDLSELQARGVIGAVGVSCHDLGALKTAAGEEWVQVIQARINPFGPRMDAEPEKVMPVLKKAHDAGKGVIGMKIFGCGQCASDEQRQKSLEYVWGSGNVDAMTLGFSKRDHIDDALQRIKGILS